MSVSVQRRRGTTVQHAAFTGAIGELTVDTTKNTVVVHDGTTAGGHPLATEAYTTTQLGALHTTISSEIDSDVTAIHTTISSEIDTDVDALHDTVLLEIAAPKHFTIIDVTGNKTLALTDDGKYQNVTAASVITIPPSSEVAFLVGTQIPIFADTADEVSILAGTDVTIKYKGGLILDGQNAFATLYKVATDTWHLVGALKSAI